MRRIFLCLALLVTMAGAARAADGGEAPRGRPIPHQIIPMERFAAFVKNWNDESMPHYAIITNPMEWDAAFAPAATMGGNRPFRPDASLYERAMLVSISRISAAPAPGERVLVLRSLTLEEGQAVLAYSFIPPARPSSHRVKNTLLVALPIQFADSLRIVEETETADSLAADLDLEEAIREGRIKQVPPPAGQR